MIIGVHTRPEIILTPLLLEMAAQSPATEFILFHAGTEVPDLPMNCRIVRTRKVISSNTGLWYFTQVTLRRLLRSHKVDVLISEYGCCVKTSRIPQWVWFDGAYMSSNKKSGIIPGRQFMDLFFSSMIKKSAGILVPDDYAEQALSASFPAGGQKMLRVDLGPPPASEPKDWEVHQAMLEKISTGHEFIFVQVHAGQTLLVVELMKAFSRFKKLQKSGMRLFLADPVADPGTYIPALSTYKFRHELVTAKSSASDCREIVPHSIMFIDMPGERLGNGFGETALSFGIPVIAEKSTSAELLYGEGALYVKFNQQDIAAAISELYKSDVMRGLIGGKGKLLRNGRSVTASAATLLDKILNFVP